LPVSANIPLPANKRPFRVSAESDHFPTLETGTSILMFSLSINGFPTKKFPLVGGAKQAEQAREKESAINMLYKNKRWITMHHFCC